MTNSSLVRALLAADVRLLRQGQDVVLDLGNGHDSIRLKDWLTSNGHPQP